MKDSMRKKKEENDKPPLSFAEYRFVGTLFCPRCKQKCLSLNVYPTKVALLFKFERLCPLCDAEMRKTHIEELEKFAPFDFFMPRTHQRPKPDNTCIDDYCVDGEYKEVEDESKDATEDEEQ